MTSSSLPDTVTRIVSARLLSPLRRLVSWAPAADGRVVLLLLIGAYLGIIACGRWFWQVDWWPALGVPSAPSLFFDARNMTAAWECHRLGYDPIYENPCDPWNRPLNYLRPWLIFSGLGLDQSHTFVLGAALTTAMFGSFALLLGRVPAGTGIVAAIAACSPAVMLAVERANMDTAIFTLSAAAALLWRVAPAARPAAPVLLLLGALGKMYPVFALPAFVVSRSRAAAGVALACLAVFALYFVYSLADVRHVLAIAPQGQYFSYGARILPAHLYHQIGADSWAGPAVVKQLIASVPLLLIACGAMLLIRRTLGRAEVQTAAPVVAAPLLALHIGALVYLGTFVTGNSYDYRLVFVLLTLPQLLAWVATPHRLSPLASVTLALILALLWVGSLSELLQLWDELASWAVAAALLVICGATIPLDALYRAISRARRTRHDPIRATA